METVLEFCSSAMKALAHSLENPKKFRDGMIDVRRELQKNCLREWREAGLPTDAVLGKQKKNFDVENFCRQVDGMAEQERKELEAGFERPKRMSRIGRSKWDSRIRKPNEVGEDLVADRAKRETRRKEFCKAFDGEMAQERAVFAKEKEDFAADWDRWSETAEEKGVKFCEISGQGARE